jgi:hypothetical protein
MLRTFENTSEVTIPEFSNIKGQPYSIIAKVQEKIPDVHRNKLEEFLIEQSY